MGEKQRDLEERGVSIEKLLGHSLADTIPLMKTSHFFRSFLKVFCKPKFFVMSSSQEVDATEVLDVRIIYIYF